MPLSDMSAAHLASQSGAFEPQRTNNILLRIAGISTGQAGEDLLTLALESFPLPKTSIEPLELPYLNEKRRFATFATAENMTVTVKDFIDKPVMLALYDWFREGYDPFTGQTGLAGNYKKTGTVTMYGPNGAYERELHCLGMWISNFDPGEADMTSGDKVLINLDISIDKVLPGKGITDGGETPKHPAIVGETNSWLQVDPGTPTGSQYTGIKKVNFTWFPSEFTTSAAPNWESVDVLGRSEAYKIYANTSNREIPVTFEFFAQGPGNLEDAIEKEVLSKVRFLESLAYPSEQGNGLVAEPAVCFLKLGNFLLSRVIMTSAPDVTYMGPYTVDSELPMHATVSCTFTEVNRYPKEVRDVLQGSVGFTVPRLS